LEDPAVTTREEENPGPGKKKWWEVHNRGGRGLSKRRDSLWGENPEGVNQVRKVQVSKKVTCTQVGRSGGRGARNKSLTNCHVL